MTDRTPSEIDRRTALKVIAVSASTVSATTLGACAPGTSDPSTSTGTTAHEELSGFAPLPRANPLAAGTPTDPDLLNPVVPWGTVLSDEELRLVASLCDLIIPADDRSPAASEVGVPEYVNQYVSAPY
ncbi:MAG: gluconate 2-dehydrogenase subunit 3 family protein, partial [Longimicrobiales bacterium]